MILVLCSLAGTFRPGKAEVRAVMDEMLEYHVEYHAFSPLIARRTFRLYVEHFDPEKLYLLSSEARPWIDASDTRVKALITKYIRDDFSEFETLNQSIQQAILRARRLRQEVVKELVQSDVVPPVGSETFYSDYATSGQELKARINKHLARILAIEKRNGTLRSWDVAQRQKLFDLWERRFTRMENAYLANGGNARSSLCMHVLKAMAKSLDAHTSYFSPEEAYEMRTSLEKQFEGIGVILREGIDGVVIHDMIKGGPAERSGKIVPGDLIVEIDGKTLQNASYDDILRLLQGSGHGSVRIGLRHFKTNGEGELYRVELKREKIVMQDDRVQSSFERYGDGIIGKISLPSFYESGEGLSCEADLKAALRDLKKQGDLKGLVLDMRENSGGFLNQAVKVAGLFVSSGIIVISKYAHGETQYLRDLDGRSWYNGPLVILTSRGSASAAEIVAQALQDYGVGLVIGDDRTYGKGTIQYQTVTDVSATSFFKVTVGRYYTVSGRTTQIDGVIADIIVPTAYSALAIGERYLQYPLKSDRIPSAYVDTLSDIDPANRPWFQKNYLANLQKKISLWTQMLPQLSSNSACRMKQNQDYSLFLNALEENKKGDSITLTPQNNWGVDDLQMIEAVNILKDMAMLSLPAEQKVTAY